MPTTVSREECERIISHIPGGIVRELTLSGTPEQIADQIRTYAEAGLRDVVLWNITPFADPAQSIYSFKAMKTGPRVAGDGAGARRLAHAAGNRRVVRRGVARVQRLHDLLAHAAGSARAWPRMTGLS